MLNTIINLFLILLYSLCVNGFWGESMIENNTVPGEYIIMYNNSHFLNDKNSLWDIEKYSLALLKNNNVDIKDGIWKDQWWIALVTLDTSKNIADTLSALKTDPNIDIIEPNYLYKPASIGSVSTNDFFWGEQWWLTYISWDDAYNTYKSKLASWPEIAVWVIDAWVNYNHVDLKDSMWNKSSCKLNWKSIGCNHWYDFFSSSSISLPVWDNHWTHIAGIIAASINNWKGMVGVNPYAKIASLKVTDDYKGITNSFDDFSILKAIDFSIENWIKIINASYWGYGYSEVMKAKIKEFWDNWWLFVTTAMNDWIDMDNWSKVYPCAYDLDNIICVTAFSKNWARPSFANVGRYSVDIAAPGEDVVWTVSDENNIYDYYENFNMCSSYGWSRWYCTYEWEYQFCEWVSSPSISLKGYWEHILKFNVKCNWSSSLTVSLFWDSWFITSYDINVGYSSNEYKIIIPNYLSRFSFNLEQEWDGSCYLDNVGAYQVKYYWDESDSYDIWWWTSMATPFVSWLASLIRSLNPSLSPLQVKNLILNNWDDNSNFKWNTVSWKTINVKRTLDAVTISANRNSYSQNDNNNGYSKDDIYNYLVNNGYENLINGHTQEENDAFDFAKKYNLTTASSINTADMDWYLNRISMAKIISQFAINVMWLQPDTSKYTTYYDVPTSLSQDFWDAQLLAYQLWIMWVNVNNFRPYDIVTRAEFATIISRLVYKINDWTYWMDYYEPHLNKLRNDWILTNADPFRYEKRGLAFLILMRIAQQNNFIH